MLGTIATGSKRETPRIAGGRGTSVRILVGGGGTGPRRRALTSSSAAVALLELAALLFLFVVFEVARRLLRETVAADGARGDVKLAAAAPCGLLYGRSRLSKGDAKAWERGRDGPWRASA